MVSRKKTRPVYASKGLASWPRASRGRCQLSARVRPVYTARAVEIVPEAFRLSLALSQDFRKFKKKSKAGAGKEKLKKISALRGKKSEIPGPSPQDLGIPIGQISSPSYASRTLAPSSQSMHSQNSRARSRSLSYDSSRSVRARPATAPAPTANTSAVAAAIPAPDAPDAGHQLRLALLAPQRPQVPDVGGRGAHHVFHDIQLRERPARLLAPQGHVWRRARLLLVGPRSGLPDVLKFNKAKRKAEKEMMEQAAGPN
jgi:hypothetical protein